MLFLPPSRVGPDRAVYRPGRLLATLAMAAAVAAGPGIRLAPAAEPLIESWLTGSSARYARIYETDADQVAGNVRTTWARGTVSQALPAYCGVQEVLTSPNWVYLRTTGLGSHVMGPWYLNVARSQLFPNLPANQRAIYRFPRVPTAAAAGNRTLTGLGAIGYFVDGVAMFDGRDAFFWNGTAEANGTGSWNRDAYVNEGVTFDPATAHQQNTGVYHYHANPIALRHLLGDHVVFDPATGTYRERTNAPARHSPILGWVRDGFPIYGPYGYANATNPASGIRRMISGYLRRDGSQGTDNLAATGRAAVPAWASRLYGAATLSGPPVSADFPLGRYMEDNAYRGDLGQSLGVQFDLDEENGRFCVTPEFPNGTYAYFIALDASGAPAFPYHIGRAFHGVPSGNAVTAIAEAVTTNFTGGASSPARLQAPDPDDTGAITLIWSSVEGGTYTIESSPDLRTWTPARTNLAGTGSPSTSTTLTAVTAPVFFRASRASLAPYDGDGSMPTNTATGPFSCSPTTATRGTLNVLVTFTFNATATPPLPPAQVVPSSVTIGSAPGTAIARPLANTVTARFNIPAGSGPPTPQTVTIEFPGPNGQPGPRFALTNGFTFN